MSVLVRPATTADARAIARVHIDSWEGAYRGLLPDAILDGLTIARREAQWGRILAERALDVLVGEVDGRVVGFAGVAIPARDADERSGVGEIPAIYVTPLQWRAGVGSALEGAARERLRAGGCDEAVLWMLGGNSRAAGFYEALGWRDDGGRRPSQYFPAERQLVEIRFRRAI
jgi:GNAT superfamily N-acetyltransferase